MTEKIELVQLDFDIDAIVKKSAELQKVVVSDKAEIKSLNQQFKDGKISTNDYAKEFVVLNARLKSNQKAQNLQTRAIQAYSDKQTQQIQVIKQTDGSINQLSSALSKNRSVYKDLTKEQRESAEIGGVLQKTINEQDKEYKALQNSIGTTSVNVGDYKNQLGTLSPALGGATNGIATMTKAALLFLATPLGLILGGIALAIAAVSSAFTDSEEGQNKFAKITGVIGVVLGNLKDVLADVGELIIGVFENPKQAITDFANLIKNNIVNRFEGMLELIPNLAKAVQLLFKGEFGEAGKIAVDSLAKVSLGVEGITDSFAEAAKEAKGFFEQTLSESNQAIEVANKRAKADKLDRELLVEKARIEAEIAELRLKSRQEDQFGAEERRKALLDAQELEDQLLNKEREALTLRADAIALENTFSRSSKENLDAEAEAKAKVLRIEAARLNQQRSTQRELNRINREIERDNVVADQAELKRVEDFQKRKQELENKLALEQAETDQKREILKIEQEYEKQIAELERIEINEGQKTELIKQMTTIRKLAVDSINEEFAKIEEERQKRLTKESVKSENEKLKNIQNSTGELASLLNEGTAAGKAAGISKATVDTFIAANEALKLPPPFGEISAAARIVTGLANVSNIVATPAPTARFEHGGLVQGNSHASGGVPFRVQGRGGYEMEGGEYVVNKKATAKFLPQLEKINNYGSIGFNPTHYQGGGQVKPFNLNIKELAKEIGEQVAIRVPDRILLDEIDDGLSRKVQVESAGDV